MTATLSVVHHAGALERVRSDVAAVGVFAGERPLRHSAGRADWRLCGQLSRLILAGRLRGEPGDAVLVPTFGGLRAPLLLALGLGPPAPLSVEDGETFAAAAVLRGLALRADALALALPPGEGALDERLDGLVLGAAGALAGYPGAFELGLVTPHEDASAVGAALRSLPPRAAGSVRLELPGSRPRRLAPPPAGAPPSAPPRIK